MRVLITGGAGFIGSHLAQYLISNGHSVDVLDNLSTGSKANIAELESKSGFRFYEGDIQDTRLVDKLTRDADMVYHLAAAVGVRLIAENPVQTIETNISGTQVVLEAANRYRKKILLASSSEVYGKSDSVPFAEDDDLVLGSTSVSRWSYACSKAIDEFLGMAFYHQYALEVIIARFFNTIGPRQTGQYGMVVPRFIQQALKNEPLSIYGDGKQTRCFCYVDDVVEAIVGLMDSESAGHIYNIGTQEEVSIEQLADKVIALSASTSSKTFIPYDIAYGRPMEDMMRRVPDIKRIGKAIGWTPKVSLDEALNLIIEHLRVASDY